MLPSFLRFAVVPLEYLVIHGMNIFCQTELKLKWRIGEGGPLNVLSPVHDATLRKYNVQFLTAKPVSLLRPVTEFSAQHENFPYICICIHDTEVRSFDVHSAHLRPTRRTFLLMQTSGEVCLQVGFFTGLTRCNLVSRDICFKC